MKKAQDAFFVSWADGDDYRAVYYRIDDTGKMTITYANITGVKE